MSLPYPITTVHGDQAVQTLNSLRKDTHSTPIILGGPDALERMIEAFDEFDDSVEALLAQAANIDPLAWLAEQEAEARADADADELEDDDSDDFAEWMNEAAEGPPLDALSTHLDVLSQQPLPQVSITQLPTREAWQAACFLKIGGWNAMPEAPVHSALWQMWHAQYGAQVACVADDVIEFTVSKPPTTAEAAQALARQQAIYCPDIVDQGQGSEAALAASLLGAKVWYFWWD